MERILRSTLACVLMSISLLTCTSSGSDAPSESLSPSIAEQAGVTLVLGATHGSNGCCRIFTMNPGAGITVACGLVALDPEGRLVYAGVVPAKEPGHLRSSGFEAPPGRHGHGVIQLPIDLALDSYTAPCRPAAWHGGAPI